MNKIVTARASLCDSQWLYLLRCRYSVHSAQGSDGGKDWLVQLVPSWIHLNKLVGGASCLQNGCWTWPRLLWSELHTVHGSIVERAGSYRSIGWLKAVCGVHWVWNEVCFLRRYALERRIIGLVPGFHHRLDAVNLPWLVVRCVVGDPFELAGVHDSAMTGLDGGMSLQGVLFVGDAVGRVHVHVTIRLLVLVRLVLVWPLGWPPAVVILESGAILKRCV